MVGSLAHYGFTALALHGDMEQREREEVLVRATARPSDVAARGLDIDVAARSSITNYPPMPALSAPRGAPVAAPPAELGIESGGRKRTQSRKFD